MLARYRISFNVNLYFSIKEDIETSLEPLERATLILHPSKGTPNTGEITVEVTEPNETFARNRIEEIFDKISLLFTIEKNTRVGRLNIENIDLENPEDFEGVPKTHGITKKSNATFVGSLDQKELDHIGKKLHKIHALDQPERDILLRFLRVYSSGKKGRYPSDELIYRWTALEIIVSSPNKRQKTWNSINDFISQHFPVVRAKNIIQEHNDTITELIKANLHDFENKRNYSEVLKEELQKSRLYWKEVLKHALRCIYEVRNGVLHRSEDFIFLSTVNRMLDYILMDFWEFRSPT